MEEVFKVAYRLEAGEKISVGIPRLLLERVNQIVEDLTNPELDRDKGVHEARKNCKRIRAAYRLIRDEIGRELYRQENIRFRDTARLLASARDAWVMIRTLDRLVETYADQLPPDAFSGVRQQLMAEYEITLARELENDRTIPEIVETMHVACVQIESLPIRREGFPALRKSVRRVYRRGRRAMQQAYDQPDSEIFHEWRKRVKYLWHQVEILEALWPNLLSQLADELHTLSDYLGDDHDLAVLRETILRHAAGFEDQDELMRLIRLIDQERLKLESLAQPLGERLYFEPPRTFVKRLETYWDAWQKEAEEYRVWLIDHLKKTSTDILPTDDAWLTTAKVAAHLEISPQKVRELIYDRKLPAEKVGGVWIVETGSPLSPTASKEDAEIRAAVLLSTREAANRLGTTPEKVRALIRSDQLDGTKIGRIWVIRASDLAPLET